jgi:hypothetical protein
MSELKDTLITGILECSGNTLIKGNLTLQSSTVALGSGTSVGANSVSIGLNAGSSSSESISIGVNSGNTITGGKNIAIGTSSNIINTGSNNIFIGENSMPSTNSSVSNCISIGTNAQTNFSNSVSIGGGAVSTSSNQIVLGTSSHTVSIKNLKLNSSNTIKGIACGRISAGVARGTVVFDNAFDIVPIITTSCETTTTSLIFTIYLNNITVTGFKYNMVFTQGFNSGVGDATGIGFSWIAIGK